ncbi:hypothetical protein MPSEU_000296000 [Mayamaea pseudoterrestris]|nr:hypothetical protein MPSEU_000296000 [Mayamaea pseudoterrestris]
MASTTAGYQFYEPVVESGFKESGFSRSKMNLRKMSDSSSSTSKMRVLSVLDPSGNMNNLAAITESGSINGSSRRGADRDYTASMSDQQTERLVRTSSLMNTRSSIHKENTTTSSTASPDQIHCDSPVPIDGEEVMIEERRKRPNGDGFTTHMYRRGRMLGKGGFAKVYLCTALDTNKNYAVKLVPKANLVKTRARQKLQTEIKIHRMLKHDQICEYKHYFEDRDNCYILLELCHNQSMNEMIKRRKRLTEPEAAFFTAQILKAVRYMHNMNVIHRDLKLGNLFLDKNVHIKVGDLGLACRLEDRDEKRKTICGTPNYIAPEVIQGDKSKRGHSFEVDIWSIGVILYTILVGKPPYESKDVKSTYQRILSNMYSFPSHVNLSNEAKDLIEMLLQSNPADRPSIDMIEAHPFLSWSSIPRSLPSSVLHLPPTWGIDESGIIFFVRKNDTSNSKILGSVSGRRQPLGYHDPNTKSTVASIADTKLGEPGINMQRIVRTAMANSGVASRQTQQCKTDFRIYDESAGTGREKPPGAPSRVSSYEDSLIRQTKAMSLAESSLPRAVSMTRSQSTASVAMSATSTMSTSGGDTEVLLRIADRLDAVLDGPISRPGFFRGTHVRPVSLCYGPRKWVTRYVDYTAKYGLGFLLNDQCSGVYFNDSTKTVLDAHSETFQYIERRKTEDSGRAEALIETYTLSKYPESLKKKVTLLKHFQSYLMEHHKGTEDDVIPTSSTPHLPTNFVFVKKWLRTKHAILFRLSNQTVQVVFYDQTELLITPDERYITYVDKNRERTTYNFTSDLVASSTDMEKRLRYTKDIITQLITGRRCQDTCLA